eukprot:CAMPEP_0177776764 /NCGR_PEP_ID=MMETSP0491_2-20121128/14900_1 /TAXON_ID=63592 /ORGANISM="Tetraselmis chuii, Strain PLY429" /LENGTH=206 /DNA_ID=CAMNT_0019295603 /DNA_START=235 /DNA_END=852 /DNA_ORIENTATION=-
MPELTIERRRDTVLKITSKLQTLTGQPEADLRQLASQLEEKAFNDAGGSEEQYFHKIARRLQQANLFLAQGRQQNQPGQAPMASGMQQQGMAPAMQQQGLGMQQGMLGGAQGQPMGGQVQQGMTPQMQQQLQMRQQQQLQQGGMQFNGQQQGGMVFNPQQQQQQQQNALLGQAQGMQTSQGMMMGGGGGQGMINTAFLKCRKRAFF